MPALDLVFPQNSRFFISRIFKFVPKLGQEHLAGDFCPTKIRGCLASVWLETEAPPAG
jgi:hypothetical protein